MWKDKQNERLNVKKPKGKEKKKERMVEEIEKMNRKKGRNIEEKLNLVKKPNKKYVMNECCYDEYDGNTLCHLTQWHVTANRVTSEESASSHICCKVLSDWLLC